MVDLNDVALFVQVVRCGSFAEAARRLGLPSNTVSRRVQALESQLGTRLLQRSTRKLTLTGAGEAFHARCAHSVDGLIEAGQEMVTGQFEPNGRVRIAAPADFFDFFQMEWVSDFLAAYPRVRLDFVLSDAKADLIGEGIDVAFRGGPLLDSGYVGRKVLVDGSNSLVASPSYIESRGLPETLSALAGFDGIGFSQPDGLTTWQLAGPGGDEEVQMLTRFSGNTAQALRRAAVAGLGIALLPHTLTSLDLQAGRLVQVLPQYRSMGYGLNVLYPSRRHLPLAVAAFIDLVIVKLNSTESGAVRPQD